MYRGGQGGISPPPFLLQLARDSPSAHRKKCDFPTILLRQSRQNPRPTLSNPSAKCRNSPPPPPSGGREAEVAPFGNPTPVALAKRGGRRRRRREENERRCFMSLIQPREGKEKCAFPRHEKNPNGLFLFWKNVQENLGSGLFTTASFMLSAANSANFCLTRSQFIPFLSVGRHVCPWL